MAHRDALGSPALAELSGTAALLEMARVFKARDLRLDARARLDLGRERGRAPARARSPSAPTAPVDAAIVLGDIAGRDLHKPWIVPWSNGERAAPMALAAHGRGARCGARWAAQAGRLARDRRSGRGARCR